MKTVTIYVEEDVYEAFKKRAAESGTSAAAVIREAMQEYKVRRLGPKRHSVLDRKPLSAGGPIKPITSEDDILGEMIDEKRGRHGLPGSAGD